jgi:predicted NBD/HSP70 family sugar kinase
MKSTIKQQKHVASQQLIKESNLKLIFKLINQYQPVSRAELANKTGLSPTTVSSLTEELINNEFVIETGIGESATSGRKPIMLEINCSGGYVASFEMILGGFILSVYDLKCNEISDKYFIVTDYNSIGEQMIGAIESHIESGNIDETKLLGICIGVPGLIDIENKRVISSTVVPVDENNDFYSVIKKRFNNSLIYLGNQSCFYAYAENIFGVDKQVNNLIFMDINVGIGAGIILNGQIFTGSFGFAGEIGHMTIDANGPKCKCGNKGCLEAMASIPAIIQIVKDKADNKYNEITIDLLVKEANSGDDLILQILNETSEKIAVALNNIINLFNPEMIVIGGDIIKFGDILLDEIKKRVLRKAFKNNLNNTKIIYSRLGKNAVTLGGARYVLDSFFK